MVNAAEAYKRNQVLNAPPEQLTLMLYNGCLKFIDEGVKAVEGKKYDGFYKKDLKDGFGIYYCPEKFFIGFWKEGKQHGISKYIKGKQIKYCRWKNGKKEKMFSNEEHFFNSFEQV